VQYHPEASPGPHDAYPHFREFLRLLHAGTRPSAPTP
jgi:carbamoylphosphate synthase small subunit